MLDAGRLVKLSSHTDSLYKGERLGLCLPPTPSLLVLIICKPWWPQVSSADFCINPGEAVFIAALYKRSKGCFGCSSGRHTPPVSSLTSAPRGPGCDQKHCYLALLLAKSSAQLEPPAPCSPPSHSGTRRRGLAQLQEYLGAARACARGGGREGGAPRRGLRVLSYTLRLCCGGPSTGAQ